MGNILAEAGQALELKPIAQGPVETVAGVSVIIAIALLLVAADLKAWLSLAPKTMLSCLLSMVSVLFIGFLSSWLFKDSLEQVWQIAGMLVGTYTGSTANLLAVGAAIEVDQNRLMLVHTADLLVCALYLIFLLTAAGRFFGLFLRPFPAHMRVDEHSQLLVQSGNVSAINYLKSILLGIGILGLAAGIAFAIDNYLFPQAKLFDPLTILATSTVAIGLSFITRLRQMPANNPSGDYLLLVFSLAVGSLATWEVIQQASLTLIGFTTFVVIGSAFVHGLLCFIFKIDRDTMLITNVAGIFGPPFIPPMARALGNPQLIVSGITSGLLGLAVGTYLGLIVVYGGKYLLGG